MGYRLEFNNPNQEKQMIWSCGGKFFGYVDRDILERCKSWKWIKEHGFFNDIVVKYENGERVEEIEYDEEYAYSWDYGIEHKMYLTREQFKEFIALYIGDRNLFWCDGWEDSLENYSDALKLDVIECGWW